MVVYLLFFISAVLYLFFPSLNLFVFSPFLISLFYFKSLESCLIWSFAAGIFIDLFSYTTPLGMHAFAFCAATFLLYDRKQHFFLDNLSTFPLMTAFFSVISTLILAFWCHCPMSFNWIVTDLIFLPLLDAIFAFLCYTLPYIGWGPKRRSGQEYFL